MNSRAPQYIDQQVLWEAQAVVMEALNCSATVAVDVIRQRAESEGPETIRAIVNAGVANFATAATSNARTS